MIPYPLAVRFRTSTVDRHITRDLRTLRFRSVAPGGYAEMRCSFDRPLRVQPDDVEYFCDVYVYDTRSGSVVWEGRLEDPGRSAADGEVWDITAVGPSAYAYDQTFPIVYVDRDASAWGPDPFKSKQIEAEIDAVDSTDNPLIRLRAPRGTVNAAAAHGGLVYRRLDDFGQKLARIAYTADAGVTDSNWRLQLIARPDALTAGDTALDWAFSTTSAGQAANIGTDFTVGRDLPEIRLQRNTSSSTPANDDTWAEAIGPCVRGTIYSADGTEITTGSYYSSAGNAIRADEVVKDLLGRILFVIYDGVNATVTTTGYAIDSLAYPDGVTAGDILADLAVIEPLYYWAAWESTGEVGGGPYRFEYVPWPTSVRYEADLDDGADFPGSAAELFNGVRVFYTDAGGRRRSVYRTQAVTELDTKGITRTGVIDVPYLTSGPAAQAGDQWLAERATPPNAGTLTIARPIRDLYEGRWVSPWEIKPGQLIRVRGVLPRVDALNATTRDGVTVFKIVASEFDISSGAARLELDSFPRSAARALARANARRRHHR